MMGSMSLLDRAFDTRDAVRDEGSSDHAMRHQNAGFVMTETYGVLTLDYIP